jgi:hypothetical protein
MRRLGSLSRLRIERTLSRVILGQRPHGINANRWSTPTAHKAVRRVRNSIQPAAGDRPVAVDSRPVTVRHLRSSDLSADRRHPGGAQDCHRAGGPTGSKKFDREPPHGTVRLDISDRGGRRKLTATFRSCVWGPADEDHWQSAGDYTFLKLLDKEVPAGLDLARTSVRQLHGLPLYAYGFPENYDENRRSASLKVANNPYGEADGLVRVYRDGVKDELIEPGLSGAPAPPLNADYSVIGIIKADDVSQDRSIEEAYIIPGEILNRGFAKIAILHHIEWLKQEERQHRPKASIHSRAKICSSFGDFDIAVTKIAARSWRYVPAYFFGRSETPNVRGGRFN